MKIYDISQECFTCAVFPGDKQPIREVMDSIEKGSICNTTRVSMSVHNSTHVDAPYHFYKDGKTIDQIDLNAVIGPCYVGFSEGAVTEEKAKAIISKAKAMSIEAAKRILIGGDAYVTLEAAKVFTKEQVLLVGNEAQTVGPLEAPAAVHYELLGAQVVLLEGIRLSHVNEGVYLLNAAPLNFGGSDGAPCRAILLQDISD